MAAAMAAPSRAAGHRALRPDRSFFIADLLIEIPTSVRVLRRSQDNTFRLPCIQATAEVMTFPGLLSSS
jgi:hypothetical protein